VSRALAYHGPLRSDDKFLSVLYLMDPVESDGVLALHQANHYPIDVQDGFLPGSLSTYHTERFTCK
jgi:hypothetical protein